jgi:hypothetical protein
MENDTLLRELVRSVRGEERNESSKFAREELESEVLERMNDGRDEKEDY